MEENTVFVKIYHGSEPALALNSRELRRYSGYMQSGEMDDALRELYAQVVDELLPSVEYKVCYRRMKLERSEGKLLLPFDCTSADLEKLLAFSQEVVIFAATAGLAIDRYIAKYQLISPAKALVAQALGAERIETLCNVFCDDIQKAAAGEGLSATPRYSPGYGDMPLATQTDLFRLLDCNRQIGLSLNSSLLMMPSKSVTALFGLAPSERCRTVHNNKCSSCSNTGCAFRDTSRN